MKDPFENLNAELKFDEFTGVNRCAQTAQSAIECFNLFFTNEIWEQVIRENNRYHDQVTENDTAWIPILKEEMKAFIGVTVAMGIVKLPEIENYWRKDGICNVPWFSSIMSIKRYKQILRFLHLNDNTNVPEKDAPNYKLYKLGGLHEKLCKIFSKIYSPSQELSIDEQMVGTKCRVGFIQYMPQKPKNFGIKIWVMAEAATGYCLQFQVYTGKSDNVKEHGLSYRVVTDLLSSYLNKNHHVYFDNFFASIALLPDLSAKNTFCCGTIRQDRGRFPENLKKAKLQRGESVFISVNDLLAVHWKDKRDVFLVSTIHGNQIEEVLHRGEEAPITKPRMITQYNCFMNGVDRCDQYLASYSIQRKTTKWWKKLFLRFVGLCIMN